MSCIITKSLKRELMDFRTRQLKRALEPLREALESHHSSLEELESALIEFEENLRGESQVRPLERKGLDLLSIPEVCQELGMGKSWVYRRIQSGEIPSVKLGRNIKVRREDLEGYLEDQRYHSSSTSESASE